MPREGRNRRSVLLVVLGRRGRARRAPGRSAQATRARRAPGDGERSAGELHARPAPSPRPSRGASARGDPGWAIRDRAGERSAAEHRPEPAHSRARQARAGERALRRAAPARADDAGDLRCGARARAMPHGGHVPRLRPAALAIARQACVGVPGGPDRPSDRRVRAIAGDRDPTPRRRVRADPERRPDPRAGGAGRARAPHRLRRQARAPEGPAGAPARVAGDPPADRGSPARGRCRADGRPAPARAAARLRGGDRHPRLPLTGGADRRAALREGSGRALPRRRKLRHGAHARVRLRDARRRLGHPWLSGRHGAERRSARSARRAARTGRGGRGGCLPTSRGASSSGAPRGNWPSRSTPGTTSQGS